jgi:hypothetical protein
MTTTTTKNIMDFVKDMIADAWDQGLDIEDVYEAWPSKEAEVKAIIEAKPKSKTSSKDPNKPKRARSAYIFYSQEVRPQVKSEMPGEKSTEVTKEIAARWKVLKQSTKQSDKTKVAKYTKMAEDDKKRATEEMESYTPPTDEEILAAKPKRGRKTTSAKKSEQPKKGRTAYNFFCTENRPIVKQENPDADSKEVTRLLSQQWKDVKEDEDEVQIYKDMAAKDKKRYEREMLSYEPDESEDDDGDDEPKPKKAKTTKTSAKKITVKKATKDDEGFKKYCNANRAEAKEENPELKAASITKLLKEEWEELSDKEKVDWANEEQE